MRYSFDDAEAPTAKKVQSYEMLGTRALWHEGWKVVAEGVILNLGGHGGGWSFYLKDGKPAYCYNLFGLDRTYVRAEAAVPPGEHQLRVEFAYDGLGKGGEIELEGGDDSHDHLIDPEDFIHLAMAKQ
jgi:hypothetical protein